MKPTIQLPYLPKELYGVNGFNGKTPQLDGNKRILSYAKDRGYTVGVLVYTGNSNMDIYEKILSDPRVLLDRLKELIGSEMWKDTSLHFPMAPWKPDCRVHLGKEESFGFHINLLDMISDAGIKKVILHPNTVYYVPGGENSKDSKNKGFVWNQNARTESNGFLDRVLKLARRFRDIHFAYENMPIPIKGTVTLDPKEILIEPNLLTVGSIEDFLRETRDYPNISLCLDTSHYLITKGTLQNLRENPKLLDDAHIRMLIGSISPHSEELIPTKERTMEILEMVEMPSLTDFVKRNLSRITDVQISDGSGWIPSVRGFKGRKIGEGLPLTKGEGHYGDIVKAISLIKKNAEEQDAQVSLSFDVTEKDYVTRENQKRTLLEVLSKI